jgi:hypothetical protein
MATHHRAQEITTFSCLFRYYSQGPSNLAIFVCDNCVFVSQACHMYKICLVKELHLGHQMVKGWKNLSNPNSYKKEFNF